MQLLFAAILVVAGGSLPGQIAGIKGFLGDLWFWFGHQGWEFLELGRFWQILLFVGLIAWLGIVYRAIRHHIRLGHKDEFSSLILFYVLSAVLVVAFFGFGLVYGKGSHLTVADYWRWFVVHIWVESIFEFFGVAVISLLLVTMGLATARAALMVAYFTASIVFLSGILGTAHWSDRTLQISFFGLNAGLLLLTLGTLFPVGILQSWVSFTQGLWMARDASFFERDFVTFLGTVRIIPDLTIIVLGVLPLAVFLFRTYPHLKATEIREGESVWDRLGITL